MNFNKLFLLLLIFSSNIFANKQWRITITLFSNEKEFISETNFDTVTIPTPKELETFINMNVTKETIMILKQIGMYDKPFKEYAKNTCNSCPILKESDFEEDPTYKYINISVYLI